MEGQFTESMLWNKLDRLIQVGPTYNTTGYQINCQRSEKQAVLRILWWNNLTAQTMYNENTQEGNYSD